MIVNATVLLLNQKAQEEKKKSRSNLESFAYMGCTHFLLL